MKCILSETQSTLATSNPLFLRPLLFGLMLSKSQHLNGLPVFTYASVGHFMHLVGLFQLILVCIFLGAFNLPNCWSNFIQESSIRKIPNNISAHQTKYYLKVSDDLTGQFRGPNSDELTQLSWHKLTCRVSFYFPIASLCLLFSYSQFMPIIEEKGDGKKAYRSVFHGPL